MVNNFSNLWNFFKGHIRCVNLKSRKDRKRDSQKIFNEYDIPVNYYTAIKHPNGGEQGCFESHINMIREAYYAGAERVLIFEDDITPTDYLTIKHLSKAIKFMTKHNDWDIFYLGALPNTKKHRSESTNFNGIYKIKGICTHSYIVNRRAMSKLIHLKYRGVPIDYYFINNLKHSYALYPTLFYQGLSPSDIVSGGNWWSSYATKSSVSTFYRCNEAYAYYVKYPLYMVVPLIILIIAWFVTGMNYRYHVSSLIGLVLALFLFGAATWN